jgi:AraC-like DNA-binding protein
MEIGQCRHWSLSETNRFYCFYFYVTAQDPFLFGEIGNTERSSVMTISHTANAVNEDAVQDSRTAMDSPAHSTLTMALARSHVVAIFYRFGTDRLPIRGDSINEDAFLITVYLAGTAPHHDLASHRHSVLGPSHAQGTISIVPLGCGFPTPVHISAGSLCFQIPRAALDGLSDELLGPRVGKLSCPPGTADQVLAHLGAALLPAFENPAAAQSLFVDQLARTVVTHLLHCYGGFQPHRPISRGGLSFSQEKRAKAYLAKNYGEDILLADVAKECGLSRGHFIRAFRLTTGLTPRQWLQRYRLEKAKSLLRGSSVAIAEIAGRCGFADQSHLTRVFTATLGVPPGAWRRQHRI